MLRSRHTFESFDQLLKLSEDEFRKALKNDKTLIKARANQNKTLLHHAVRTASNYQNWGEKIRLLIELGADLNAKDELGRTPLHTAMYYSDNKIIHEEVVPILLQAAKAQNFDFNQRDTGNNTILRRASEKVYTAYELSKRTSYSPGGTNVDRLLEMGVFIDLNKENVGGLTPVMTAGMRKDKEMAVKLVYAGADIEKKTKILFKSEEKDTERLVRVLGTALDPEHSQKYKKHLEPKASKVSFIDWIENAIEIKSSPDRVQTEQNSQDIAFYKRMKTEVILARLIFLTKETLSDYEKDREGRGGPDPQRTKLVSGIRKCLIQIENDISENKDSDPLDQIQTLVDTLHSCGKDAEKHHKENGTVVFFGHGLTSSGLARGLDKLTSHTLLKHVNVKVADEKIPLIRAQQQ